MKHLFQQGVADEMKTRLARLRADSPRQWGRMTPAQMLAHCDGAFQMATGDLVRPRILAGRVFGGFAKRSVIVRQKPMMRNSPTDPSVMVVDDRDFAVERDRLLRTIDRFVAGGPARCTRNPHFFFGPLAPEEWASLMYVHLDHHCRQFGV